MVRSLSAIQPPNRTMKNIKRLVAEKNNIKVDFFHANKVRLMSANAALQPYAVMLKNILLRNFTVFCPFSQKIW